MSKKLHAEKSPSSFPMWDKCLSFESGPVGAAAEQGTYEHSVLEKMLKGESIGDIDDQTLDKVTWAYETILEDVSELGAVYEEIEIEERVSIVDDNFNELTFGTLDVAFLNYLYDYKSGEIRNYWGQMACYALGMMQARSINEVHVRLLFGRYKKKVSYTITRKQAEDYVFGMVELLNISEKPCIKNEYCGWCAKQNSCEAVTGPVKSVAKKLPEKTQINTRRLNDLMKKPFEKMNGSQISELIPVAEAVSDWAKSVISTARSLLDDGKKVPGWKLQSKPGNLSVKDAYEARKLLESIELPTFLDACSVSLPKLSKAYRTTDESIKSDKAARVALEEVLSKVLVRANDSVSMVKDEPVKAK